MPSVGIVTSFAPALPCTGAGDGVLVPINCELTDETDEQLI